MDANALTPRDLFDGKVTYEVPPFQRPYVWTEEDQWQPLWDDIERLANAYLERGADSEIDEQLAAHFLGAVVLKQLGSPAGDPSRRAVIDGQQRLTTLQLLLDAAQLVVEQHGHDDDSESLSELVLNTGKRFSGSPKRFKLWPSRVDRPVFEQVMDNHVEVSDVQSDSRIAQAHTFFQSAMREWAEVTGDPDEVKLRLATLVEVLQQHLRVVTIGLGSEDDDQLIFETLNDRGTPLLAADLIKNFVFQQCEEIGADVDTWADDYWLEFDNDWWRHEISQGRLLRSRIDLFLQYWITMSTRSEVPTDAVFARFRAHAAEHLGGVTEAEAFLKGLRRDADTYRDLTNLDVDSARGRFYWRVVEALELGAFIPLLLWMISENNDPPNDQVDRALSAVESWAVRRTLLRMTMKDVNRFVVSILQELDKHSLDEVGDVTVAYLERQDADSRVWPNDSEVIEGLPKIKVYGSIKQSRMRAILAALELHLRMEPKVEKTALPQRLDIEHVMPQGWRSFWDGDVAGDLEASARRDHVINTIGNLTLVTQKLNVTLSNRPWTDAEAQEVAPTGKEAGVGKRSLLNRFSVLMLNKEVVQQHPEVWTEQDIHDRSRVIAERATQIWTRPASRSVPTDFSSEDAPVEGDDSQVPHTSPGADSPESATVADEVVVTLDSLIRDLAADAGAIAESIHNKWLSRRETWIDETHDTLVLSARNDRVPSGRCHVASLAPTGSLWINPGRIQDSQAFTESTMRELDDMIADLLPPTTSRGKGYYKAFALKDVDPEAVGRVFDLVLDRLITD